LPTTLEILDVTMRSAWVYYKNIFMNLAAIIHFNDVISAIGSYVFGRIVHFIRV